MIASLQAYIAEMAGLLHLMELEVTIKGMRVGYAEEGHDLRVRRRDMEGNCEEF